MKNIAFLLSSCLFAQVDVLMSQYDLERTAVNRQERTLHPANVNSTKFGKLFSRSVDNSQYALPLIVSNVDLPGGSRKNLMIVATMSNTVYAFDADSAAASVPIWSRNLGTPMASGGFTGPTTWGILGTPFIDRATSTIYVVAKVEATGGVAHQINALDLATGALKYNSPQNASFPVAGGGSPIIFSRDVIQRAGLLVNAGVLYIAFANIVIVPGDGLTQEGYLQSFNATDLSQRHASFQVTPTGLKGGIWQAGRGLSVDAQGSIYLATAGGEYNGVDNFGSSILKFAPRTLALQDWFTPSNWEALYHGNLDPSANGVTLIPGTTLAFAGGKEGVVYLLNLASLGKLETNASGPLQRFQASAGCGLTDCAQNLGTAFWSRPSAVDSMLYVWDRRDFLRAYRFNNTTQRFNATAAVGPLKPEQAGGPSVSALGDDLATGIVWAVTVPTDANATLTDATLRAYRASDVTQETYNSGTNAARDRVGFYTKFAAPVVANGKVYVATHSNEVAVYGLLNPRTLTVAVTGSGSVTSRVGGIACPPTCTATVADQDVIELNPFAVPRFVFTGWTGACSGNGFFCNVVLSGDQAVGATFARGSTLTLTVSGGGIVTGSFDCSRVCSPFLPTGTSISLTARPSAGFRFAGWAGGSCDGTQTTCQFNLQGDANLTATFAPITQGYYFLPTAPCRAADTRPTPIAAQGFRDFTFTNCTIPAVAVAAALNVTIVPKGPVGFLTIWPAGQARPVVSTMNSLDGRIKANAAIVGLGTNNAVSVYVTDAADVVLDVNGYFVPAGTPGALAFYPATPCRVLDTRLSNGGGIVAARETRRVVGMGACLPAQAAAYSLNVTVVPQGPLGYLTLWPDGVAQPTVSTLNALTGTVVANAAILQGGVAIGSNFFVTDASHLIVDTNGYFAAPGGAGALTFYPVAPCRLADTRLAGGALTALETREFNVPTVAACSIPVVAQAYVLNATVVPPAPFGFLTLWPGATDRPVVSTLNAIDGAITSNAAIVPASSTGVIRAFASDRTHLLLDISGYFAP